MRKKTVGTLKSKRRTSGLILMGGKSSRMGTNKALLPWGGTTVVEEICSLVSEVCDEILIVTSEPKVYEKLPYTVVLDCFTGKGPMAGIHAGLLSANYDQTIVIPCDLPLLTKEYFEPLLGAEDQYDVVVYTNKGKLHPLFARYRKSVLPLIEESLLNDERRIRKLFTKLQVKYIEAQELSFQRDPDFCFLNMNSKEDYEEALSYLQTLK